MSTQADVRRIALALPETSEAAHFHLTAFRVNGKIFATLGPDRPLMLKFAPEDQGNLVADDPVRIGSVPGAWGRNGSTFVQIDNLEPERLESLVRLAWATVAPKRLSKALGGA
ncbi:MAG: hypothetical protein JWQ97_700 [Phenylobacterium sp.]|nr:hypothetical protein [Phenylobacterium sp.]